MPIVARVLPLSFCFVYTPLRIGDVGFCLVNSRRPMAHIGLSSVDAGVSDRDFAHLGSNSALLIRDLTFQYRLGGFRLFQGVLVWTRIDDEQKLAFPDKLVVVDFEFDDRALDLRCNANQVRENFCSAAMLLSSARWHQSCRRASSCSRESFDRSQSPASSCRIA